MQKIVHRYCKKPGWVLASRMNCHCHVNIYNYANERHLWPKLIALFSKKGFRRTISDSGCSYPTVFTAVECDPLTAPVFGEVILSGTILMSTATYRCFPGYFLVGVVTRECQATGFWSGQEPTCERMYHTHTHTHTHTRTYTHTHTHTHTTHTHTRTYLTCLTTSDAVNSLHQVLNAVSL